MRGRITIALGAMALLALVAPANAANVTVYAVPADAYNNDFFSPSAASILPGESVTWVNNGGIHNVRFEDGQFTQPATPTDAASWPASVKRTFPVAGFYRYYCEMHGGSGMAGTVQVGSAGPPPGSGGPGGGSGGSGSPTGPGTGVKIESLAATRRRFCNRRGPLCRRPGIRLRIDLSVAAEVTGTLRRKRLDGQGAARRFGKVDFGTVAAGSRTLRFRSTESGRRLSRGRYSLTLKAGQDSETVRFRVVR